MSNQTAVTSTINFVPVQGVFDQNGVCISLIGPGGESFSPPVSTENINNSIINSSTIGLTTPAAGAFTTLSSTGVATLATVSTSNAQITGGSISGVSLSIGSLNNTPIGNITPSTGAFTTLSATTSISGGTVSGSTVTATSQFTGPGTGLTGTATSLSIGGNAATASSASTATNLTGGGTGTIVYQSSTNTTAFLPVGSGVLQAGTTPTWTTAPTISGSNISGTASGLNIGGNAATATLATSSTNLAGGSTYSFPYQTGSGSTSFLSAGTSGSVLMTLGTVAPPVWVAASSLSVSSATNISNGTTGAIPYQSASSTTTFLSLGTSGYVVTAGASAPQYTAPSSLSVGTATNLAGGGAGYIPYQSASGTTAFLAAGTTGQVLQSNGSSAPTWTTVAGSVTISDDTSTNATRYPLFANQTSGSVSTEYTSSTKLQYNPSTGLLTATGFSGSGANLTSIPNSALVNSSITVGTTAISLGSSATTIAGLSSVTSTTFVGALSGNATSATSATTATNANNVAITDNTSSSSTWYPTIVAATSGNTAVDTSSTKLSFVPSTGSLTASQYTANGSITSSSTTGAFNYGALASGSADVNIFASFTSSVNNYNQIILQNTSSGTAASTDVVVNNNNSTASTYYGDYGMNSSGWTGTAGTNSFNAPNMVYLTSTTADLLIGTTTANTIRFATNGGADAMTINSSGVVGLTTALAIGSGGTGQTTASAAFNALSPITTTGDLIIGNGTNSATRLGIGANGYVLTSNGTTATWAASTGGVTSFSAGTTGLTPSTATTGAITLAGTLAIANGGTGLTALGTGVQTAIGNAVNTTGGLVSQSGTLAASSLLLGGGSATAITSTTTGTGVVTALGIATNTTSGGLTTIDGTATLTNKRVTPRVNASTANSATPTLNTDSYDMMVITGQSTAITSFTTNLSGTPTNGQKLWISITGTTAIAITWGTSFESSTVTLPTTTVSTNRLDIGFVWNVATSKWRCVATA